MNSAVSLAAWDYSGPRSCSSPLDSPSWGSLKVLTKEFGRRFRGWPLAWAGEA